MAPCFSRNAVLRGIVDHFCLICETHLMCEDDVTKHIMKPVHVKGLNANQYIEKYKDDCIRKINKAYHCEFCNYLMTTSVNVGIHVKNQQHIQNKNNSKLQRSGNLVIALNIGIPEAAWNGLHENTCALCNIEYEDQNIHKTQISHVLKLIQTKVQYDGNNIYRQVDETLIHCITCNVVLMLESKDSHWDTDKHVKLYQSCCLINEQTCKQKDERIEKNMIEGQTQLLDAAFKKVENPKNIEQRIETKNIAMIKYVNSKIEVANAHDNYVDKNDKDSDERRKVLESIPNLQASGIEINFETNIVHCRQCSTTLNFDLAKIKKHIKKHAQKSKKQRIDLPNRFTSTVESSRDNTILFSSPVQLKSQCTNREDISKNDEKEVENLAQDNNITYNHKEKKLYCVACKTVISYSLELLNEHVAQIKHKNMLQKNRKILKKVNLKDYITLAIDTDIYNIESDVMINKQICITWLSYWLMKRNTWAVWCYICQKHFNLYTFKDHLRSDTHAEKFKNCPIITNIASELIREIRRDIYHCGYCNMVVSSWEIMEKHVMSAEHLEQKNQAQLRLKEHIRHSAMRAHLERSVMLSLLEEFKGQ